MRQALQDVLKLPRFLAAVFVPFRTLTQLTDMEIGKQETRSRLSTNYNRLGDR